jgi:O-succinylbenzoic acid--CoA ligase
VRRLVALELVASPAFVDLVRRTWDDGDAFLPIDPRLPAPARRRLLEALRPGRIVAADGAESSVSGGVPVEDGDAVVVATSGTTGEPKGVVLTHAAVAASAAATSQRLEVDPHRDRWLACLPVAHVGGLSVILRALHTETPLDLLPRYDTDAVVAAARQGATLVSLVPTTLRRLGAGALLYRSILLGGSAPPEDRPANVVTTYGLTETGSGVVYDGVPLDGVELAISPGGEVLVRCPMSLRCYRDGTDPHQADGWLSSGDAGALDDAGVLSVYGRIDDVIITGGENVWPEAVEAVLRTDPLVREVAVAGRADPEWGHRVVAYVVPVGDGPALGALRELVASELGRFAAPRELVLVEALPRTASGKVQRRLLGPQDEPELGPVRRPQLPDPSGP